MQQQLAFYQDSGKLFDVTPQYRNPPVEPVLIGICYSGNGAGLNNSAMDRVRGVGVIRRGKYTGALVIEPRLGPKVWNLTPDPSNDMKATDGQDRDAFKIHWDTPEHVFSASDGCLIPLLSATFDRIAAEFELVVEPGCGLTDAPAT